MGKPKALLPFGPELMVQRVVRILSEVVAPMVVVAARDQELPLLPAGVIIARDGREGRGPLEGLRAGMSALASVNGESLDEATPIFVTSCDVPLLQPAFIREMLARIRAHDVAVPVEEKFAHPLAAVYRLRVLSTIAALLSDDQLRPAFLMDRVPTLRIPVAELRSVDPDLLSLRNCNYPAEYEAALALAGFATT